MMSRRTGADRRRDDPPELRRHRDRGDRRRDDAGQGPDQTAVGGLAIRLGDKLRLDLLGEIGGQRYGNVFEDDDVVTGSTEEQWLVYVGLRPASRIGSSSAPKAARASSWACGASRPAGT